MFIFWWQHLCWLALFTRVSATSVNLLNVLQNTAELSTLYSYVNASSNLTHLLSNADDFTFLAASNDAIATFVKHNPNTLTQDVLLATLQYSLLQGVFPSLSFSNTSQFVSSNLISGTFTNVTGGQVVELGLGNSGDPQVISGNKTISPSISADIVCTGGLVHVIDTLVQIPVPAVLEISEIPLEYFISILNTGGYLGAADASYVNEVLNVPDVTYFIPNTADALANFTTLAKTANASELQAVFQYHFVPGWVGYSSLLKDGMTLKTAQGRNVSITVQGADIYVNAARVIASDYLVANGVVHVIDDFLNRFDTSGPPAPIATTSSTSAASSTPTSTTVKTVTATPSQASSQHSRVSATTIGVAVGVSVAGVLIIAGSVWVLMRNRKRRRESRVWDQGIMSSGKFYLKRGQVQRQEDLALGLQSTGMHEVLSVKSQDDGSTKTGTG